MRWPEKRYIVSLRHGFLYAPVEKVACSTLKEWAVELEEGACHSDANGYVRDHYELHCWPPAEARRHLADRNLLRFAFVRDPWDRLVSAYLNKFVPLKAPAAQFLNEVYWRQRRRRLVSRWSAGWLGSSSSAANVEELSETFTFRQFVQELRETDARSYDSHWRPQSHCVGDLTLDFLGRFETLEADFRTLCDRLGLNSKLPRRNMTERGMPTSDCLADWTLAELRTLPAFPGFLQFYTPDLIEQVGVVYAEDLRRFGYEAPRIAIGNRPNRLQTASYRIAFVS